MENAHKAPTPCSLITSHLGTCVLRRPFVQYLDFRKTIVCQATQPQIYLHYTSAEWYKKNRIVPHNFLYGKECFSTLTRRPTREQIHPASDLYYMFNGELSKFKNPHHTYRKLQQEPMCSFIEELQKMLTTKHLLAYNRLKLFTIAASVKMQEGSF